MAKKVSELPLSKSTRHMMLALQKRGVEAMGGRAYTLDGTAITLIGLCEVLKAHNIGNIAEIVEDMKEAK